jgi:aminomethyltransferase
MSTLSTLGPAYGGEAAPVEWRGTPFSPRTREQNRNALWMAWDGRMVVDVYNDARAELYAIRHAAAMGDMSPLSKYEVRGPDAEQMIDHLITRDVTAQVPGQVYYTPWCDDRGKLVNDGLVIRVDASTFWLSADPNWEWMCHQAESWDVELEDITDRYGILTLQGPTAPAVLAAATDIDWSGLPFSRRETARIAEVEVQLLRQGFTGEIGYELWVPAEFGVTVWDAVAQAGAPHGVQPAGAYALDVARVEAGLLIIGYDYTGAGGDPHGAAIDVDHAHEASPYELGLGRFVDLEKADFVGRAALAAEAQTPGSRRLAGVECDWRQLMAAHDHAGAPPLNLGRVQWYPKPLVRDGNVVGHTSSLTWGPSVGALVGFAHVDAGLETPGTHLSVQWSVGESTVEVEAMIRELPLLPRRRSSALG